MKILENGILRDATPEELAQAQIDATASIQNKLKKLRVERNQKLLETDWTQSKDMPDEISNKWVSYRQELRDITKKYQSIDNVVWPTKPE